MFNAIAMLNLGAKYLLQTAHLNFFTFLNNRMSKLNLNDSVLDASYSSAA